NVLGSDELRTRLSTADAELLVTVTVTASLVTPRLVSSNWIDVGLTVRNVPTAEPVRCTSASGIVGSDETITSVAVAALTALMVANVTLVVIDVPGASIVPPIDVAWKSAAFAPVIDASSR